MSNRSGTPRQRSAAAASAPAAAGGVPAEADEKEHDVDETPIVEPTTEVVADLTDDDELDEAPEPEVEAPEPESTPEPEAPEVPTAPEPAAEVAETVTFVCDRWAGVSLFGTGIKFNDGVFTTSDPNKVAVLDAWEHARREG